MFPEHPRPAVRRPSVPCGSCVCENVWEVARVEDRGGGGRPHGAQGRTREASEVRGPGRRSGRWLGPLLTYGSVPRGCGQGSPGRRGADPGQHGPWGSWT